MSALAIAKQQVAEAAAQAGEHYRELLGRLSRGESVAAGEITSTASRVEKSLADVVRDLERLQARAELVRERDRILERAAERERLSRERTPWSMTDLERIHQLPLRVHARPVEQQLVEGADPAIRRKLRQIEERQEKLRQRQQENKLQLQAVQATQRELDELLAKGVELLAAQESKYCGMEAARRVVEKRLAMLRSECEQAPQLTASLEAIEAELPRLADQWHATWQTALLPESMNLQLATDAAAA